MRSSGSNSTWVCPVLSGVKVVSVTAVVTVVGVTVLVINGSANIIVHRSTGDTTSVIRFKARLAAVMATTIREFSDLVTAVVSVSCSLVSYCSSSYSSSNSNSGLVSVEYSWVGQDSSALGCRPLSTLKNTTSIESCACYVN